VQVEGPIFPTMVSGGRRLNRPGAPGCKPGGVCIGHDCTSAEQSLKTSIDGNLQLNLTNNNPFSIGGLAGCLQSPRQVTLSFAGRLRSNLSLDLRVRQFLDPVWQFAGDVLDLRFQMSRRVGGCWGAGGVPDRTSSGNVLGCTTAGLPWQIREVVLAHQEN
jgi:hypothetical protein